MAPSVDNPAGEEPVELKVYEFSDGARLKLTAKDAQAYQATLDRAAADRAAWERGNRREEPAPAAPDVVPLTVLSKAELVELAEKRGLATSGTKGAIAARFVDEPDHEDEGDEDAGDGEPTA